MLFGISTADVLAVNKGECNDCQRPLSDMTGRIIKARSTNLGPYYDGPAICGTCSNIRYEKAWAQHESEKPGDIEVHIKTRETADSLTDAEIAAAFEGTNFGTRDHRRLLEQGVLKINAKYRTGYTLACIMQELGLIGKTGKVLKKGNRFAFWALRDNRNSG